MLEAKMTNRRTALPPLLLLLCIALSMLLLVGWQSSMGGSNLTGVAGTPSSSVYTVQGIAGGTAIPVTATPSTNCTLHQFLNSPSSGTTQIAALVGGQTIRICAWGFSQAAGGGMMKLSSGTGVNCGTGTADLTETYQAAVLSNVIDGLEGSINAPSGAAVCLTASANVTGNVWVQYAQF